MRCHCQSVMTVVFTLGSSRLPASGPPPAYRSSMQRMRHGLGLKSKYSRSVLPLGVQMNAILLTPDASLWNGFDGFHQKPQYNSVVRVESGCSTVDGAVPSTNPTGYFT